MSRFLATLALSVFITVTEPSQITACPGPPPALEKNDDGTYSWNYGGSHTYANAISCFSKPSSRVEEWTALPEHGGQFIRRLPNVER